MLFHFIIDKTSSEPIYMQLVQHIHMLRNSGELKPGDRLPSERDLSASLGIARGTIKRAFQELRDQGLLQSQEGSGNYLSFQDDWIEDRHEQANAVFSEAFQKLLDLRFSQPEAIEFFARCLDETRYHSADVEFLIIGCNPESLFYCRNQLKGLKHMRIDTCLLSAIENNSKVRQKAAKYDAILMSEVHLPAARKAMPDCSDKMYTVALSLSNATIVEIASLSADARIGLSCHSPRFMEVMHENFDLVFNKWKIHRSLLENSNTLPDPFLNEIDVLIVPKDSWFFCNDKFQRSCRRFLKNGGRVITFDYELDSGSIIHVQSIADKKRREKLEQQEQEPDFYH